MTKLVVCLEQFRGDKKHCAGCNHGKPHEWYSYCRKDVSTPQCDECKPVDLRYRAAVIARENKP